MLRIHFATLASAAVFALGPEATLAQGAPINPVRPRVVFRPDLIAIIDRSTVIVFKKESVLIGLPAVYAQRPTVDVAQCAGLTVGQSRAVAVPPLRWGVANGLVHAANPVGGPATQFTATLSYQTVVSGFVADVVVNQPVDVLASGGQRFFTFTESRRPSSYNVTLFREPQRPPVVVGGKITQSFVPRTFCIPSAETIDNAMVITVDAAAVVDDSNRANNVLRLP